MSRQETPAAGGSFLGQQWHNTREEGLCWSWVGLVPLFSGLWLRKGSWWKESAAHLSADREAERERGGCRGEKRGMVRGVSGGSRDKIPLKDAAPVSCLLQQTHLPSLQHLPMVPSHHVAPVMNPLMKGGCLWSGLFSVVTPSED